MLTQQELGEKLSALGEPITTQTMRNRERQELVSSAYKGGAGRPGRSVFYPDRCVWEHFAASKMLQSSRLRLPAKEVREARKLALKLQAMPETIAEILKLPEEEKLTFRLAEYWLAWFLYAREGCPSNWAAHILICDYGDVDSWGNPDCSIVHDYIAVTQKDNKVLNTEAYTIEITPNNYRSILDVTATIDFRDEDIVRLDI